MQNKQIVTRFSPDSWMVTREDTSDLVARPPVGIYRIRFDGDEFILQRDEKKRFTTPPQLYGKAESIVHLISADMKSTSTRLGVIMHGKPGDGKTTMAEVLANDTLDDNKPVIVVDVSVPHFILSEFVRALMPCYVLIDEFDVTFPTADDLLPLLSDSGLRGVTTVITTNNPGKLPPAFKNRTGRFKYLIDTRTLAPTVVMDIVDEAGVSPFIHWYIKVAILSCEDGAVKYDLSVDTFKEFINLVKDCTDLKQMSKKLQYLNMEIPGFLTPSLESTDDPLIGRQVEVELSSPTTAVIKDHSGPGAFKPITVELSDKLQRVTVDEGSFTLTWHRSHGINPARNSWRITINNEDYDDEEVEEEVEY